MSTIIIRGALFASLSVAAAVANVALAVPAHAAEPTAPTAIVRYADLDLATAKGADTLAHRVRVAAVKVCGEADPRDLERMAPITRCRAAAVAEAMPKADALVARAQTGVEVASMPGMRVSAR